MTYPQVKSCIGFQDNQLEEHVKNLFCGTFSQKESAKSICEAINDEDIAPEPSGEYILIKGTDELDCSRKIVDYNLIAFTSTGEILNQT